MVGVVNRKAETHKDWSCSFYHLEQQMWPVMVKMSCMLPLGINPRPPCIAWRYLKEVKLSMVWILQVRHMNVHLGCRSMD